MGNQVEEIQGIARLGRAGISFPNMSVNRQKPDGEAGDVLIPDWASCGVATWMVLDVIAAVPSGDGRTFSFKVEHDPEEENYYHSEIRAYVGNQLQGKKPPEKVKNLYRLMLSQRSTISIRPRTGSAGEVANP